MGKLTDVRKSGHLWWLRPDGKTQVTIEYMQNDDGSVEPLKIHTVVISSQHAEPKKATKCKEMEGYTGPDETAPSMEEMNRLITKEVVEKTLEEIILKNGKPALTLYGAHTNMHINPSGKFIIGGPLTILMATRLGKKLSYAIGVAKPLSLFVETYGTEQGKLTAQDITNIVKIEFDARPGALAVSLALREPKYQVTAAYSHFGREAYTKDGMKFFEWENAKDLSSYKSMTSAQVSAALTASTYLTKWVD